MRTVITGFNGAVPRATDFGLPDNVAVYATNVKLTSGEVRGQHTLSLLKDFADLNVGYAYRIPGDMTGGADFWMKFQSLDAVVIHSPVTNDSFQRFYWHEPGKPLRYATLAQLLANPWNPDGGMLLGVPNPVATPGVAVTGGSDTVEERTYTYTFVSAYGEEGPPALPSDVVSGFVNGTWNITGMDTTVPDAAQRDIVSKNIYRAIVSADGTAAFQLVDTIPLATATYDDTKTALEIAAKGINLASTFWAAPPPDLDGVVSFPGGVIIGWRDETVYMTVPYRPWAWPEIYQISVQQPIIGIGVSGNVAVVCTRGEPYAITMSSPDAASPQKIEAVEPCQSRGSIVGSPEGVFYASQNGLMLFGMGGFTNVSRSLMSKEEWLRDFNPTVLRACRYQTDFIGLTTPTGVPPRVGYVINAEVQPMTLIELTNLSEADNIFNDIWTGEVMVLAAGKVWKYDDVTTPMQFWRWATKRFFMPYEVNFAAARIGTKRRWYGNVAAKPPGAKENLIYRPGNGNVLPSWAGNDGAPAAVNPTLPEWAVFTLNVYVEGKLVQTRHVTGPGTIKLLDGVKSQDWQFEIIGRRPMAKFEFAESAKELAAV